ncbi:lysophospholipid acyltransferase family protein [Polluticoccus soli]|uniref:lysophospholipid acyltransferase family protein n=1 Tax=Polluticoccus soli TaxID=3034150 RepID=UPI0023E3062D|nr:lysophospholipid acyltransferase family protein [Flavipsychrobacter sp. JY13-12]
MYYLLLVLLYPISLLPLQVLYLLSDLFYIIVYHLVGYRKAIVMDNLQHAFPQKTEQELLAIRKEFYRNFCDQWIETIKLLSISQKELNKRVTGNWEVFHQVDAKEKNTYALLGHTFNWEWANVVCQYNVAQQFVGFYMPATSEAFDKLMIKARTRSGAWLISMKAKKAMQRLEGVRYIVGLVADQNPSALQHAVWLNFMNRETAFFNGPEKLARRAKAAVVFAGINKVKRGYYNIHLHLLTEDASHTENGFVMQQYVQFMVQQLHSQPANWLWTHKRWKHKRS